MLPEKQSEVLNTLSEIDVFVRRTMIERIEAATDFVPMRDLPELLGAIQRLQSSKMFGTDEQASKIDHVVQELEASINLALDAMREVIRVRSARLGDDPEQVALAEVGEKLRSVSVRHTTASRSLINSITSGINQVDSVVTSGLGPTYDVALSFAGEDRATAERIAKQLKARGVSVFYDNFEKSDLWGRNLYTHLSDVYENRAKFCLIFISQFYAKKLWTRREREAAQARAFRQNEEYILPLVLDDTRLPGIDETVGYVDLRLTSDSDVVASILAKLR